MYGLVNSRLNLFYFIIVSTGFLMWVFTLSGLLFVSQSLFYVGLVTSIIHNLTAFKLKEENLRFRIHLLVFVGYVFQVYYSFCTGGFYSVVINWIAILPLIIGLIAQKKDVLVWILITSITPFVMSYYQEDSMLLYEGVGKEVTHFFTTLGLIFLNGVFTFFMMYLFDKIREKEKYESEVNTIFKSFASLNQVSHDINNGFMKITGEIHLLEKKGVDVDRVKKHINQTIKDLGILHNSIKNISFDEKFDYLDTLIQKYEDNHDNIKFNIKFIFNEKLNIYLIDKVIDTLLKNSLEANAKDIFVDINKVNEELIINFKDDGEEISNPEKIFEPFFSTKNLLNNRGIGLSSLKLLLNKVNGSIKLKNSKKKEFEVRVLYDKVCCEKK